MTMHTAAKSFCQANPTTDRPTSAWEAWKDIPALDEHATLVVRAYLGLGRAESERLSIRLTAKEELRASRFVLAEHRRRYVVAHAVLREVLGWVIGPLAARSEFVLGTHGKPELPDRNNEWQFNLSHAGNYALIALHRRGEIGVDIEPPRSLADLELLVRRFFAEDEAVDILAAPTDQQLRIFLNCWTRKEAYLKALGSGLSRRLQSFSMVVLPDENPRIRWDIELPEAPQQWQVITFDITPDTPGALVRGVSDQPIKWLDHWSWSAAERTSGQDKLT